MIKMYKIYQNEICEVRHYSEESIGIEEGFVTVTQDTEPSVGWTRVDENSDFTDTIPYTAKRGNAYPRIEEQLDKLYHDIDNGTLTTSGDFYTAINTVKTNYPKS